jgi:hypothetical protein
MAYYLIVGTNDVDGRTRVHGLGFTQEEAVLNAYGVEKELEPEHWVESFDTAEDALDFRDWCHWRK